MTISDCIIEVCNQIHYKHLSLRGLSHRDRANQTSLCFLGRGRRQRNEQLEERFRMGCTSSAAPSHFILTNLKQLVLHLMILFARNWLRCGDLRDWPQVFVCLSRVTDLNWKRGLPRSKPTDLTVTQRSLPCFFRSIHVINHMLLWNAIIWASNWDG